MHARQQVDSGDNFSVIMTAGRGATTTWQIDEFRTRAGNSPIREFLAALDGKATARAVALIRLLGERGNQLRLPASKALDGGLFELRDLPTGIRIFYVFGGTGASCCSTASSRSGTISRQGR